MARDISNITLPPDVLDLIPQSTDLHGRSLEDLGKLIRTKRDEAINHRVSSGYEEIWVNAEEAYIGIDDMNRSEYAQGRWVKPPTLNAPVTTDRSSRTVNTKRSTAFVRLTSRYVDAGAAKVCEILLPPNDKAFSFEPEPVPALIQQQHDLTQATDEQGNKLFRPARQDETHPLAVPYGSPLSLAHSTPVTTQPNPAGMASPSVPLTKGDQAIKQLQFARECARRAETQIWNWMVGCQHNREMRKVIFDSARLGVGVLKFGPDLRKTMASLKGPDGKIKIEVLMELFPTDCWVDVWNIFPDPACGESICNGDYIFERAFFSERQLEGLRGLPGYIDEQIDKAIVAGPRQARRNTANRKPSERNNEMKQDYEVWYFHGTIRRSEFEALNPKAAAKLDPKQDRVHAIVTLIEDIPVKAALAPLESGSLPYLNVPWQRKPGSWVGIGIGEQIQVPQRIVNAATRALLNNAGISAGPQIIINKAGVIPANKEWELTPNKIWYASNDGIIDDVRKAFVSFDVTNVGKQLMEIIEYGMRLAEESTNIPLITQGQSGATTPDTYGAAKLQDTNANQLLRDIGYQFDDFITEPLVKMYYEYLLLDPTIPAELKGAFNINAHGSVSLVERAIQDQTIAQMGPLALNPVYKIDPAKWFAQTIRSKRLNPEDFQYTPEQQQQIDSKPPIPPPQVQVAMINAKSKQMALELEQARMQAEHQLELQIANIEAQTELTAEKMRQDSQRLRAKLDTDRDTVFVQTEIKKVQADYSTSMAELQLKKELAIMDYASKHQQSLEQVKSKLADTAMRLRVQKELAAAEQQMELHKHRTPSASDTIDLHKHHTPSASDLLALEPPAQAPGKAPDGKAFQQM